MYLKDAIMERKSIRAFQNQEISKETLEKVMALAVRSISTNNAQPWELFIATGSVLDKLRETVLDAYDKKDTPEYLDPPIYGVYKERAKQVGKQLFESMMIKRDDKGKRAWWDRRGYAFFNAPAVVFICMDKSLDQRYRFDLGCITQNICLSALEYHLGTCVENQGITFQKGIRRLLNIPDSKNIEVCIAIGYPDQFFPANHVISKRVPLEVTVKWFGFKD